MKYYLYLKSHTNAPDYEDEVEAKNRDEARKLFMQDLSKYGWSEDMIESHFGLLPKDCPRCKKYIDNETELEFMGQSGECLSCDHGRSVHI